MSKAYNKFKSNCKKWNNNHPDYVIIRDKQGSKAYRKLKRLPNGMLYTPWESMRLKEYMAEMDAGNVIAFNPFGEAMNE